MQGIVTVEADRRVHPEYSEHLPQILGTDEIGGRDAIEFVFASSSVGPDDRARARAALDLTIGESTFGFEINRHCFPTRFGLVRGGETLQIEANWMPIVSDDDLVTRVMVVLRDVTELSVLRDAAASGQRELAMVAELLAITVRAQAVLEAYRGLSAEKLKRADSDSDRSSEEDQGVLREVFSLIARTPEALPRSLRDLAATAAFIPIRGRLDAVATALGEHATKTGKTVPRFRFPSELLVHRGHLQQRHGAFVHLLTNAVDHGLEDRATRRAAGKACAGRIELTASRTPAGVELVLEDDGGGLPLAQLRAKSGQATFTLEQAAEAVFAAGTSTADRVTQSSGRGIGMGAVRAELEHLGGAIHMEFGEVDQTADYVPFRLKITLPASVARVAKDTCGAARRRVTRQPGPHGSSRGGSTLARVDAAVRLEELVLFDRRSHLGDRGRVLRQPGLGTRWPTLEAATTVGANIVEHVLHARRTKRAFEGADHGIGRTVGQPLTAVLTARPQFKHRFDPH